MNETHSHSIISEEEINPDNAYKYTTLLFLLRRNGLIFGDEKITLLETGCGDKSCPVFETIIRIEGVEGNRELRIARKKENISRTDVYLSVKKQFPEVLN